MSDEFFDFNASCMQISLTIYEPNNAMGASQAGTKLYNIPLGKQIVQKIELSSMTIFMEASLKERQVYIVFRPSFCIKNMTHIDLYCNVNNTVHKFAFAEQIFIQESEKKQLIYIQSLQ